MEDKLDSVSNAFSSEDFGLMIDEHLSGFDSFDSRIFIGVIIDIIDDYVIVDVGLKSEGRIHISEFKDDDNEEEPNIKIGAKVDVYVEFYETGSGIIRLSRDKAKKFEIWQELELATKRGEYVVGHMVKRVKGGFMVNIKTLNAFLPGSQLDIRPVRNINALVGTTQTLEIIKMDSAKQSIIVSRKSYIEKTKGTVEDMVNFEVGQVVDGIVKNVTGYGAFLDLGNIDGLLHVTDISWSRVNHTSEVLKPGQSVKVKIISVDKETGRVSLGMKQLTEDPWVEIQNRYVEGGKYNTKITNITDYGVFVELEKGVEGLVHISEVSWNRVNQNDLAEFNIGDAIEVVVIDIDPKKRRLNLSAKRCNKNPLESYMDTASVGDVVDVVIDEVKDFAFIVHDQNNKSVKGLLKFSSLSWKEGQNKDSIKTDMKIGDVVNVKIIAIDPNRSLLEFGVKQLSDDPFSIFLSSNSKGDIVSATVESYEKDDVLVNLSTGVSGIIKSYNLSATESERDVSNYPIGSKVDCVISKVDSSNKIIFLSIKELERKEQEKFMSDGKGVSTIGDVIGEALMNAENNKDK